MVFFTTCNSTNTHHSERTWYCSVSDKNLNVKSEIGHVSSEFHRRRERFAFTVRKYEFENLKINQVDIILKDVIKDGKDKYFHRFEYRCENDIKIQHKTSGEVIFFQNNKRF